jgi:hypothetical protein
MVLSCSLLFGLVRAAGGRHGNLELRCISRVWKSNCSNGSMLSHVYEAILLDHVVALHFGLRVFRGCGLILCLWHGIYSCD